ncbi:MAG TPA: TonB-dependent receptor [Paludibacter sp.]
MSQAIKSNLAISLILLCFGCMTLSGQAYMKRFKVQGKIINDRTKKGIKKFPITIMPNNKTFDAGREGDFFFQLPIGNYTFVFDYYPFEKKEVQFSLKSDTTLMIELQSPFNSQYIQEVEVLAPKLATELPAGVEQLDNHALTIIPALIGERDILKAFALTAGVTSSSEGAADIQVRGGMHGQNLYLLDGIPLYSTEHFFGMVSAYNPLIVQSARLYKSAFPAEFGGKISSVVNVQTADANLKKFSGDIDISMLTSKVALNIPLVKNKLALAIAGRLSNYSLLNLKTLFGDEHSYKLAFHFKDINASLFWKLSDKDKLKLTWFNNSDGMDATTLEDKILNASWIDNRQQNVGINWVRTASGSAENQLFVYADSYVFDFGISSEDLSTGRKQIDQMLTGINSIGIVEKYNLQLSDKLKLISGGSMKMFGFTPVQINHTDTSSTVIQGSDLIRQSEAVLFSETEYQLAEKQLLTTGVRISAIRNADRIFTNLEPRIAYHGILANHFSLSASISRMTQPVHRVANPGLGFSLEVFMPSGATILPESSWNFSLGTAKDFSWNKNKFSIKADAWYKSLQNIVEFKDGYDAMTMWFYKLNLNQQTNELITQGNGKAYGIDISADYTLRYWSLSADYTLMQAENQFADLNYGRPFAASTDIRHSTSLTLERKLSSTLTLSATWQYRSGRPITIPTNLFFYPSANPETGEPDYSYMKYNLIETERNNYRTKPFHKLDITLTQTYKAFKRYNASYSVGIYNLYNRANPYMYAVMNKKQGDGTYKPVLMSRSLFPILPSFSWSVRF